MIFTFPLMYGLMFGDFGEGPLMLLLGLALLKLKRSGKKVGDFVQPFVSGAELIVMLGAATTMFGLIFGDFFGFESKSVFGFSGIFSPTKGAIEGDIANLQLFMVFILLFGVAHMTFGMGLGAYNRLRRREFGEAFFGPICSAWFYLAGVFVISQVVLSGFKFSTALQNPVEIPAVLVPLLLLGWKEGGLHALEVFIQSISNTFSYLRIWALNLSGYYVKFAIFVAFGGPVITATSLIGATAGNLLVMLLEGLIVFVQALRLHWVEWFGKFYEGGGTAFSPYREPSNWSV
jgi:V/A-type H+-transporting ATPase subunit I